MTDCYYKHKYGGLYLMTSIEEADGTMVVHYTHMYPFDVKAYARPSAEFFDGRFESIAADAALEIWSCDRTELQAEITARKAAAQ